MPTVHLSPLFNGQTVTSTGAPASGYKVNTYVAGSSTRLATYTDATGNTAQQNPITLNGDGYPDSSIWLAAGSSYKLILTDANGVVKGPPLDVIPGINDTTAPTVSQWQSSNMTPTFVSTTSFTVPGDQTSELHVGRRLQFTTGAGTVYGIIATTAFAALTTVAMTMDAAQVLDSGLSAVNLSILRNDHLATPGGVAKSGALANSGITGAAASGANSDITSLSGLTTPLSVVQGGTGANTAALARTALGVGKTIGQIVTSATSAVATGTTLIPFDDTIPQSTEGDQYMSLAITPQNASSTLVIDVILASIASSVTSDMVAALFQDSTANALAAANATIPSANYHVNLKFTHIMAAGTTSATTFKVRAGNNVAGTTTFNGDAGARRLGGVMASRITITEMLP